MPLMVRQDRKFRPHRRRSRSVSRFLRARARRLAACRGRKSSEGKKEEWQVSENCGRNAPKFPPDFFREGAPPAFHGTARTFLRSVGKSWSRSRRLVCTVRVREAKMEILSQMRTSSTNLTRVLFAHAFGIGTLFMTPFFMPQAIVR